MKENTNAKRYNISQLARLLGVHRHTVRSWIKKGWIVFELDYRNYPVFTEKNVAEIKKWLTTLRKP